MAKLVNFLENSTFHGRRHLFRALWELTCNTAPYTHTDDVHGWPQRAQLRVNFRLAHNHKRKIYIFFYLLS